MRSSEPHRPRVFGGLLMLLAASALACGSKTSRSDGGAGAGGAIGTGGSGGADGGGGTGGGTSGSGGSGGGSGGGGGSTAAACRAGAACDPSAGPCSSCVRGGALKQLCECPATGAGRGFLSCNGSTPCGSAGCGLADSPCDPRRHPPCEMCDASGSRRSCTCVASGTLGVWACNSVASGACGVGCGDRRCLAGEICVRLGQFGGTADAGAPTPTPTCAVVPDACGTNQPSCATCIMSTYGCSLPGICRDVGPQTFDCILGGA